MSDGLVREQPVFNTDWFSHHIPNFTRLLQKFAGAPVHFMEIGSYEGRSAIWLLDNVLTHPEATMTCIEPGYSPGVRHDEAGVPQFVYDYKPIQNLQHNLASYGSKAQLLAEDSRLALLRLLLEGKQYEFIYVDGCHVAHHPLEDAVLSFRLLAPGGIMCLDDYMWDSQEDGRAGTVQLCVDHFLDVYGEYFRVLDIGYAVWLERRKDRPTHSYESH